jgi:hypothetical protein
MGGASLRELVAQLIEDGKAWATAEIAVVKSTAAAWMAPAKIAVPLVMGAVLLVQAALTVLVAAVGMVLATWLGVAGGLAVGALLFLLIAGGLITIAVRRMGQAGK